MSFALSKILWSFFAPGTLLAVVLSVGLGLSAWGQPRGQKIGRGLCVAVAFVLVALATLPVGEWALTPLENRFVTDLPDQVDGIIVLGGDEKPGLAEARGTPLVALDSMRRYAAFADLARHYPDAKLLFSGGPPIQRPQAHMQDADVARAVLIDMGVPPDRLMLERTSRNTYENAVFSADLMRPTATQTWLLVTSAWHMPRAMGCFRRAGWHVVAAPTGYFTTGTYRLHLVFRFDEQMHMLTMAMHEYVGLLSYAFMGRLDSLWPK